MEHMNFTLNSGIVVTLCKEISTDISEIRNNFPKTPELLEAVTTSRFEHLARISDTVRLRSINFALTVLARISGTFQTEVPNQEKWDIFQRCLRSLQNHLQEIIYEHTNTPISMSRSLFNAMQSINMEISPVLAGDLFLPYIPESENKDRPTQISPELFKESVQEHRQAYNSSLLKMVKTGNLTLLNQMRQALVTLEPKNPYVDYRIFFDASIAFFDRLIKQQQMDGTDKYLVGKIDPELNRILRGDVTPSDNVVSSLLYLVAQSDPHSSVRIRKLQEHHYLHLYLADPNGVDPVMVEKFLNVLIKARETWTHAVSSGSLKEFKKLIQEMHQKSGYLRNAGFSLIVDALNQVTDHEIQNPGSVDKQTLSMEGASALLIMEQQLREGSYMDVARSMAAKILALCGKSISEEAVQEDTSDSAQNGGRQRYSVMYRLAEEIQSDLGGIEQNLLDFLSGNNDVKDDMLTSIKRVENILHTLNSDEPANLVAEFTRRIRIPETPEERSRLASGFAHLTGMIDLLKNSEASAIESAKSGIAILCKADVQEKSQETEVKSAVPENVDTPNDQDLLEIFLEESDEILGGLNSDLAELARHNEDLELMTRVRRAYHTLKGSGRMVGLKRFGESAWLVEDLLNRWLRTKKGVDSELLDLLKLSTESAAAWVKALKKEGSAVIDYSLVAQKVEELLAKELPETEKAPVAPKKKQESSGGIIDIDMSAVETMPEVPVQIEVPVMGAEVSAPVQPAVVEPKPVTRLETLRAEMIAEMGEDVVDSKGFVNEACYEIQDDREWKLVSEYLFEWNRNNKDNQQKVERKVVVEKSPWEAPKQEVEVEDTSWVFSDTTPKPVEEKVQKEPEIIPPVIPKPVAKPLELESPVEKKAAPVPQPKPVVQTPVAQRVVRTPAPVAPPPAQKPTPPAAQPSRSVHAERPVQQEARKQQKKPQSFIDKILSWFGFGRK